MFINCASKSKTLFVSVIIPTYNRPNSLRACLNSLKAQCLSEDWEVIVVDDGGKESLNALKKEFQQSLSLTVIRQENSGPATARNRGAAVAKGKFLAFLDDDCEPEMDWLEKLLINAQTGVMIGGRTKNKLIQNNCSEASQILVSFLYEYFEDTPWYFFTSNNFLVDKQAFISISGFDESFRTSAGEDREFCTRWKQKGYRMDYRIEALIHHSHNLSMKSFWKQHLKYGTAAIQYRKNSKKLNIPSPPFRIKFYFKMLNRAWTSGNNLFGRIKLLSLIMISQIATFIGFVKGN